MTLTCDRDLVILTLLYCRITGEKVIVLMFGDFMLCPQPWTYQEHLPILHGLKTVLHKRVNSVAVFKNSKMNSVEQF